MKLRNLYYMLKPIMPRRLQIALRRGRATYLRVKHRDVWPIDERAAKAPKGWPGWPDGKKFALVLTHDADTLRGHDRCLDMMKLEKSLGFRSCFNLVPRRYGVMPRLRNVLVENGFEVGVHGLYHDGRYFDSREEFLERAWIINHYIKDWGSVGYRSPSMLHNLDWMQELNIEYDSSTFDTDPFEPQPDGVCTIYPFSVPGTEDGNGFIELPYTLPQDFLLFVLLGHRDIHIWKQKLDWIARNGGMAMMITHPDYMVFKDGRLAIDEYPARYYREFLEHVKTTYEGQYWHALPREVAEYCKRVQAVDEPVPAANAEHGSGALDNAAEAVKEPVKRRACFLYYYRFKGSAILYREAKALKDKGFDVDIVCLRDSEEEPVFQQYEDMDLYCIQARSAQREKNTSSYFLKLFAFCIKATALMFWLGIKRRYDIIHVTSPPDILVFSTIIPKLLGARVILDIHDIGPELFMRKLHKPESGLIIRMLKWFERISTRFADHVITVTDLWKDKLIKRSVPASKCTSILNVPDDNMFKPYASADRAISGRPRLSYHGSMEEHFGVDVLIEAMPAVKAQVPDVELIIYGMGRLREACEDTIRNENMEDYVRMHDFVPFYQLPSVLKEATIGIVPTKSDLFSGEALSMKALEYMSLGIPIVVSRTPVHDYYYDDSMVRFFAPCDKDDLAKAIVELCKDEAARQRLVENARQFIAQHGWKAERERYYDIVDRLTNGKQQMVTSDG